MNMRPYLQIIVQKGAYLMKVIIEILDNFVKHFISDGFQDSLIRVQKDVKYEVKNTKVYTLSAMYDLEVIDMLRKALLYAYIKVQND